MVILHKILKILSFLNYSNEKKEIYIGKIAKKRRFRFLDKDRAGEYNSNKTVTMVTNRKTCKGDYEWVHFFENVLLL